MHKSLVAAALLALAAAAAPCRGGWPSGGCAPVGAPVVFPAVPEWEWRQSADGSRADLYHFGVYHYTHYYPAPEKQPERSPGQRVSNQSVQWSEILAVRRASQ